MNTLSPLEAFILHGISKQITPCWIELLDQFDFPIPPPAFQLTFAFGGICGRLVTFEIHQAASPIFLSETFLHPIPMLQRSAREITSHASVEHAAWLARGHIDVEDFDTLFSHSEILTQNETDKDPG